MQFIESIEDWRKELNIKEMILLGHSFGGYLASSYAIKFPERTKALLLIDPWGFPDHPNNMNKSDTPTPMWIRLLTNVSRYVSPLSLLRTTGPIGVPLFKLLKPDFKSKYLSVLGNSDLIYDYLYHCNNQYPSGEDGFKAVSEQHGFSKNPMIKRIEKVSSKIPIWFIYGSRSWIDSSPGFATKYIRNRFAYVSVRVSCF
jgi:pimeloyl-ACP methyl ester carboxylesterase